MFVVSLTYTKDLSEVDKQIEPHVAYLEKYYALGKFVASGRKVPRTGGVILADIKNRTELDLILAQDPFWIAGVADYDVIEFIPTMVGRGYENLKEN